MNEAIGIATLGDILDDMWAPDDYDLIVIIDGFVIESGE